MYFVSGFSQRINVRKQHQICFYPAFTFSVKLNDKNLKRVLASLINQLEGEKIAATLKRVLQLFVPRSQYGFFFNRILRRGADAIFSIVNCFSCQRVSKLRLPIDTRNHTGT